MREQRWPWLLTSALMLASAVAAGWSTHLYWLPCRGSMLRASIVHGYAYDYGGGQFSDACLRRMDTGLFEPGEQTPWAPDLLVLAMAVAGLAWLTLVLGLRWQLSTKVVAALPGLATIATAVVGAVAIGEAAPPPNNPLLGMLSVIIEWSALVTLVASLAGGSSRSPSLPTPGGGAVGHHSLWWLPRHA